MHRLYPYFVTGRPALGLLILRLVTGGALMLHGWPKIHNPFHWLDKMPNHPPGILQALAALSEFGGGLALVLGLLTPIAMFGVVCTMLVAIFKVHLAAGDPWVASPGAKGGSYEPALGYLAVALTFILAGPGVYSLDAMLFGHARRVSDQRSHYR
ncbi:MAG: DoxX family protein [Armatimonadota bacterium]|nr:DoxX family protein [Armatimonadota bacterium]